MTKYAAAAALRPQVTLLLQEEVASRGLTATAKRLEIAPVTLGRVLAQDAKDETVVALALGLLVPTQPLALATVLPMA